MYHLFDVTGIELEYMVVDKGSLQVRPIVDKLILPRSTNKSDVHNGEVDWSNELVSHVIEIKTHKPTENLSGWHQLFHHNVVEINQLLEAENAILMPTGAHPFMNPHTETVIWPHEFNEIYALYDTIFNCQGHGWSNVQSMHINLPFHGDEEFARLHAAIRLVLPLIPTLCASTPILDVKVTGFSDTRLEYYRNNQKRIPIITGKVIPERAFSEKEYYQMIFDPIMRDIKPFDKEGILGHHFLNSRGAISRFDRGAIEIRLIDLQEAPKADLAIAQFIIEILKNLVGEEWSTLEFQKSMGEEKLLPTLLAGIKMGDQLLIENKELLKCFDINNSSMKAVDFWETIINRIDLENDTASVIEHILYHGNLSTRILGRLSNDFNSVELKSVYSELCQCLGSNELFK